MIIRPITHEDMVEVSDWFSRRKWPMPPVEAILPKTGFLAISDNGTKLAVAWLYLTNSSLAFLEWTATNPDEPMQGMRALNRLFQHVKDISLPNVKAIMHLSGNPKMIKWLEKRQAFKNTEDAKIMIWTRGDK